MSDKPTINTVPWHYSALWWIYISGFQWVYVSKGTTLSSCCFRVHYFPLLF